MKINVSRVYFNVHKNKKNPDGNSGRREYALLECLSARTQYNHIILLQ